MSDHETLERTRLPRGPHGLTREDVADSQRQRMCWAAIEAVAELGYRPTTVANIIERAKVSRRTFYELFDNKDDCFAVAFDLAFAVVESQLSARTDEMDSPDWRALISTSLDTYLAILTAVPTAAHALHVETLAAGEPLNRQRARMQAVFAARMRRAYRLAPEHGEDFPEVPDAIFELLIGGIDDRIRDCLQTRGAAALPELAPLLYQATLALFGRPVYPKHA